MSLHRSVFHVATFSSATFCWFPVLFYYYYHLLFLRSVFLSFEHRIVFFCILFICSPGFVLLSLGLCTNKVYNRDLNRRPIAERLGWFIHISSSLHCMALIRAPFIDNVYSEQHTYPHTTAFSPPMTKWKKIILPRRINGAKKAYFTF